MHLPYTMVTYCERTCTSFFQMASLREHDSGNSSLCLCLAVDVMLLSFEPCASSMDTLSEENAVYTHMAHPYALLDISLFPPNFEVVKVMQSL